VHSQFLKRAARFWPFRRTRVLLLEDDTSMQRLVVKLLRSLRVKVELFGNGRAVVTRILNDSERYDALLLDLMMPHDGGLTVLRNLREHHQALLRKVILLTGSGSGITDPWSPLVFAVVHKPFDGSALVTTVRACCVQRRDR
jgi:DNA-binding response OmpR family regulator